METQEVTLTEDQAFQLALDALENTLTCEELESIGSVLGCNDQVCVYLLPNSAVEAEIYSDMQITGLGTPSATLSLPEDNTRNGLKILFHWDIDELADEHFEIVRK